VLTAQLLALLSAERLLEIGLGAKLRAQHGALLAQHHGGSAAGLAEHVGERVVQQARARQMRQVEEQRASRCCRRTRRTLRARTRPRTPGRPAGCRETCWRAASCASWAAGGRSSGFRAERQQPDELAVGLEPQQRDLVVGVEQPERRQQVPAFEERIGLAADCGERVPRGDVGLAERRASRAPAAAGPRA
jgi:hypothetical protein